MFIDDRDEEDKKPDPHRFRYSQEIGDEKIVVDSKYYTQEKSDLIKELYAELISNDETALKNFPRNEGESESDWAQRCPEAADFCYRPIGQSEDEWRKNVVKHLRGLNKDSEAMKRSLPLLNGVRKILHGDDTAEVTYDVWKKIPRYKIKEMMFNLLKESGVIAIEYDPKR